MLGNVEDFTRGLRTVRGGKVLELRNGPELILTVFLRRAVRTLGRDLFKFDQSELARTGCRNASARERV